tara:strand:+ start:62 stop:649 length:588 start_codon:yes stop_codon:yes gene_type:complete
LLAPFNPKKGTYKQGIHSSGSIISFWFNQLQPKDWWSKNRQLDRIIKFKFGATLDLGAKGLLANWRAETLGQLAEIIVLDQFPRHIYRDRGEAFTFDSRAQSCCLMALDDKANIFLSARKNNFLLMPLIHSEEIELQKRGVELLRAYGTKSAHRSAVRHLKVIKKFGRFPHRNILLNRESTKAEKMFLSNPGSRF